MKLNTKNYKLFTLDEQSEIFKVAELLASDNVKVGKTINDSKLTKQFLIDRLKDYEREVFGCIFLNNQNVILSIEDLFLGSVHTSTIHIREILKRALHFNCSGLIIFHNHTSGSIVPSDADITVTLKIIEMLSVIDIRVLSYDRILCMG